MIKIMRKENTVAKINIIGLVPPDDKRYSEGWTMAAQPSEQEIQDSCRALRHLPPLGPQVHRASAARAGVGMNYEPTRKCSNCGSPWEVALVWEGYVTPYPDVSPTYREWEQLWLCRECELACRPPEELKLTPPDNTPPDAEPRVGGFKYKRYLWGSIVLERRPYWR